MDFRKRLSEFNLRELPEGFKIKEDINLEEIFENDSAAEEIITYALNANKNIIMVCSKSHETSLLYKFIKKHINRNDSYEILRDLNENIQFISAKKVIVPEPDIQDVVKILEQILKGLNSFIFSLNAKTYTNIIETIKTLISINNPHLKENNINHLIGSSEALIIYFDKNAKDKFYVKNIGQLSYNYKTLEIEEIFEKEEITKEEAFKEVIIQTESKEIDTEKKVNKYKKLKEKYKNKINSTNIPDKNEEII